MAGGWCLEQFVLGRGGAGMGLVGVVLAIAGMASSEWCVWEETGNCTESEGCAYLSSCRTVGEACDEAWAIGLRPFPETVGLWAGDGHASIEACRVFSVASVLLATAIALNRLCASTGDAANPLVYVPPPCPTCMFFSALTAILSLLVISIYTARALTMYHGAFRIGFYLYLCAAVLFTALFGTTALSHYATRDHVLWGGEEANDPYK